MDAVNKNRLWKWLVTIVVPLCILLIPRTELFTRELQIFFVVTLIAIALVIFDLVDALVAAIVLFMGYYVFGVADGTVIFSVWGNTTAWMVIGSLVFAAAVQETGVMTRMAYLAILKCGGSYKKMLWALYLVAVALSILTSVAAFPLFAAIAFAVCKGLDYKIGSKEANGVVFAIMAGAIAPFAWIYNAINGGVAASVISMYDPSIVITWVSYFKLGAPWLIFDLIWMVLITQVFFNVKNTSVDVQFFKDELEKLGPMNSAEKKALVLSLIVVCYMIGASFTGWNTAYGFAVIAWAVFLPGVDLASGETLKKVNFGVVFFTVACLAIGTVGNAVGLGTLISTVVSPMLSNLSHVAYVAAIWLVATLANFLLTPVAVSTAVAIPVMQIGVDLGVAPIATMFTLLHNTCNVFMPHENTAYLLYFAFGLFTMKDFIKYNAVRMGLHFIFTMLIIVPYWYFIGIL